MTLMRDTANAKTLVEEKERVSLGRSSDEALAPTTLEPRYRDMGPIGEGGMGEVRLVRDTVVGRDVALKRVRGAMGLDEITRERFLREARVQGQLEHPSILPVYDLAMTEDRRLFFTMRRVRGRTLDATILGQPTLTRHALLAAMSRVCLAVDFAHAHGVLHRDIKPSNLMLGDYGEVYVLDWGLAKLAGSERDPAHPSGPLGVDTSGKTTVGSVLGTPGYMAPEQVRGEEVDERADVYALGACLFEILTGEPLFEIGSIEAMTAAALVGADARANARAPERDVPVELEAICVRATRTDREERFPTARAMSEAIERFLEGDRDLERRRTRAREHAATAVELLGAALSEGGEPTARKDAMREVGRALAYDPDNEDARRALLRLLTEPPRELPREVEAQMAEDRRRAILEARRFASIAFLSTLLPQTLALASGVLDYRWWAAGYALAIAGASITSFPSLGVDRLRRALVAVAGAAGMVVASRFASPLVTTPVMAMALGAGFILFPRRTNLLAVVLVAVGCVVLPLALEWTHALSSTFHVEPHRIVIEADAMQFHPLVTIAWFVLMASAPIVATCVYLAHIRDRLGDAERRLRLQAWQLRQIVPDA